MSEIELQKEAIIFGKYIIGIPINQETIDFYVQSFHNNNIEGSKAEIELLNKCIERPSLLPYYDAALSLRSPNHYIKQRLHRMFAILETRVEYTEYFLGREFSKLYILSIAWHGIKAIYKTMVGVVITPRG